MKILHVLVGYLAVIALPFHPFAFASPLAATDYDGYVDTKQNHKDGNLMKRVPGDIVEARQVAVAVPVVAFILFIVADIIYTVKLIARDDLVRGNDVEFLVEYFD